MTDLVYIAFTGTNQQVVAILHPPCIQGISALYVAWKLFFTLSQAHTDTCLCRGLGSISSKTLKLLSALCTPGLALQASLDDSETSKTLVHVVSTTFTTVYSLLLNVVL